MKKNIVPKVIFLILLIVLIVAIIIAINSKEKDMTLKLYEDICKKENYTFSMSEKNDELDYKLTVSQKNDSISIDTNSNGEHTTTLVLDEAAYYIMHMDKEYYLYDSEEIDADIIKNGLMPIKESKYSNGTEKINGKNYYYEEYDGIGAFLIWLSDNEDGTTVKTRFYYDRGRPVYIKNIVGEEEELLKIEFKDEVEESLFEIPADYAEMEG